MIQCLSHSPAVNAPLTTTSVRSQFTPASMCVNAWWCKCHTWRTSHLLVHNVPSHQANAHPIQEPKLASGSIGPFVRLEASPSRIGHPITISEVSCSSEMLNPHGPPLTKPPHVSPLADSPCRTCRTCRPYYSQNPTSYMSYDKLPFPSCTLGIRSSHRWTNEHNPTRHVPVTPAPAMPLRHTVWEDAASTTGRTRGQSESGPCSSMAPHGTAGAVSGGQERRGCSIAAQV